MSGGVHEQIQLYGSGHTHGRMWMHVRVCTSTRLAHKPGMKATWETSRLPPKPQRCATNLVKLSCRWVISLWEKGKGEEGVSTHNHSNQHLRRHPPPAPGATGQIWWATKRQSFMVPLVLLEEETLIHLLCFQMMGDRIIMWLTHGSSDACYVCPSQ